MKHLFLTGKKKSFEEISQENVSLAMKFSGYGVLNIQVLKSVNRMRREYSMEEYIRVCKKVAKNWENNNE